MLLNQLKSPHAASVRGLVVNDQNLGRVNTFGCLLVDAKDTRRKGIN